MKMLGIYRSGGTPYFEETISNVVMLSKLYQMELILDAFKISETKLAVYNLLIKQSDGSIIRGPVPLDQKRDNENLKCDFYFESVRLHEPIYVSSLLLVDREYRLIKELGYSNHVMMWADILSLDISLQLKEVGNAKIEKRSQFS